MKAKMTAFIAVLSLLTVGICVHAADILPSWNDIAPKKAITAFVEKVTKEGSTDFVPVTERIADKRARNECALFSLMVTVERDTSAGSVRPDDARRTFGNLFRK